LFLSFSNFKKKNIEIVKNKIAKIRGYGQIDNDRSVGDKKNAKEIK
jgi:hypothetical protein